MRSVDSHIESNRQNEFAVSAAGLGEGLRVSASSLAVAGNDLNEALAMLTGAGEITQNLPETGKLKNALRKLYRLKTQWCVKTEERLEHGSRIRNDYRTSIVI